MNNEYINVVLSAIDYMEKHIEEKITLEEIAEAVHFSKFHFMAIFNAVTGQNVGTYLFRRKMTHAALTLDTKNVDILSMALRCGYNSQEAFTRAFKDYFKISPSKYLHNDDNLSNLFCYPLTHSDLNSMQSSTFYEYELVELKEFRILGLDYSGDNKKKELSVLINNFLKSMYQQTLIDPNEVDCMIGYQSCMESANASEQSGAEAFYYMAGIKNNPQRDCLRKVYGELKEIVIPQNTYAKFTLTSRIELLHTEIGNAYRSLIQTGKEMPTGNYAFEKYDKTFLPNEPDSHTEFYIPVMRTK